MSKNWVFLLTSRSLFALTILTVTQNSDNNPGSTGDVGDLRYTLNTMNALLDMTPDDFEISFLTPMTIQLNGILPIVNNSINPVNITIGNPGSIPTVTIDGNGGAYSGFFIPMGNVVIQNMIFQNLTAKGGNGGDGISGGGGGMGAGGAIYVPQTFLNGSNPSVTLMNVSINNCSAVGGNGGNYLSVTPSPTGNEGGGGGGGFGGNGGSILIDGITGGAGGGGFGGDGGNVATSTNDPSGGGGGGGGGIGSRAALGMVTNSGAGGSNAENGSSGNDYGLMHKAGDGGGGYLGGNDGGGGGGGNLTGGSSSWGGGGGGSSGGSDGTKPEGTIPPGGSSTHSGGNGGDGGGGGGGGVVATGVTNVSDGKAGSGGYGGGGGGGAGTGAYTSGYTVEGGSGGLGGGGGGGGVNQSGMTPAEGGSSSGGGGGGGGGPSLMLTANGGSDIGNLGGGSGGNGAADVGSEYGGGGGGGGSGIGGAIFVDKGLAFTIQALSGIQTVFNAANNTTQAGNGGIGGPGGAESGQAGSALGNCIFLRENSFLNLIAEDAGDLLTIGEGVSFTDDASFGKGGTNIYVKGNGTVIYNGTSDYQGTITINNANFKVNGQINQAAISVCRNSSFSPQRGVLSGRGILTGNVFVNSGTISPDAGERLTLGSLSLNSADPGYTLGSLVHITIDSAGTSSVAVNGAASLAGILEIDLNSNAIPGTYTILSSPSLTGTFDSIAFTGAIPNYTLSYLPTSVQFAFTSTHFILSTQGLRGNNLRVANYLNLISPEAAALGLTDQFILLNSLSFSEYEKAIESISPARNSIPAFTAKNMMFVFSESLDSHFTKRRLANRHGKNRSAEETALMVDNEIIAAANQSPRKTMYAPPKNTNSEIWTMGFGQFGSQESQDQTPAFNFNNGGLFAAYDYGNTDQGCIGTLAGYSHSSISEHRSMGNSDINAGYLSIYGMRTFSDFFINAAIWGQFMGVDQNRNISYPGFNETAKSSYHAGQLDLHFGTGYDSSIQGGTIEPFGLLDWVVEWDPTYLETGAIPYNMEITSRTSWMFRFETGLNGYKTNTYDWGVFILQGKLSYVFKKPHNVGQLNAAILGAPSSFTVEAFTNSQSLVSPAIEFFWQTNWNGYGSISYDGEFGSGYASNQFYGKVGYSF